MQVILLFTSRLYQKYLPNHDVIPLVLQTG
jgi:hypothetical protein